VGGKEKHEVSPCWEGTQYLAKPSKKGRKPEGNYSAKARDKGKRQFSTKSESRPRYQRKRGGPRKENIISNKKKSERSVSVVNAVSVTPSRGGKGKAGKFLSRVAGGSSKRRGQKFTWGIGETQRAGGERTACRSKGIPAEGGRNSNRGYKNNPTRIKTEMGNFKKGELPYRGRSERSDPKVKRLSAVGLIPVIKGGGGGSNKGKGGATREDSGLSNSSEQSLQCMT